ncbi:MAG: hypothetical protein ACRC2S_10520 [Waterburya sp.]
MSALKYKSKVVFWDRNKQAVICKATADKYRPGNKDRLPEHIFRFDSTHEFHVYLELVRMYGDTRIVRQYPLEIFPRSFCYPNGKKWKIDFAIMNSAVSDYPVRYVEAKGLLLNEFRCTLGAFEQNDFNNFLRLCLVFPKAIPVETNLIKALFYSDRQDMLLTLPELKHLQRLP